MGPTFQITFDCLDVDAQARFWAETLGYRLQEPPPGFKDWPAFLKHLGIPEEEWGTRNAIVDPDGTRPRIFFQQVDTPKKAKNRLHFDIRVTGGPNLPMSERKKVVAEHVTRLTGHGARRVEAFEENGEYWVVMQDPEGNEFCLT